MTNTVWQFMPTYVRALRPIILTYLFIHYRRRYCLNETEMFLISCSVHISFCHVVMWLWHIIIDGEPFNHVYLRANEMYLYT
jgi:hypothetical protein